MNAALRADEHNAPKIAEASNEGDVALQRFRVVEGLKGQLVAAELQLHRPLENASLPERRPSIAMLASLKRPDADAVLTDWFDQILGGQTQPGMHLDLWLEAKVPPRAKL